jgi:cyclohexanone monooxygenase
MNNRPTELLDLAIVGGGFSGLHMLQRAVRSRRKVRLFEAGSGVGGTWYWNRYPGARVDIESLEYSYTFSDELQQEWDWSERYSPQPELLRYANHVADRFQLRPYIQFDAAVTSAVFDENTHCWTLTLQSGERVRARHVVLATGLLHVPSKPEIAGLDTFGGLQLQTSRWPEGVDLKGKRVCVIGTGSSGVQCIPEIAKVASHLTVLQRTPSFCIPARNHRLDPDYVKSIKARYPELREKERSSLAGFLPLAFIDDPIPSKNAMEVSDEERRAIYDARWAAGGLSFYTAFKDLLFDQTANDSLAEYVRAKIREQVNDPVTAEKLVPKGFPILTRRLCADTDYYATYNRDNVTLIDIRESPIERATAKGLVVGGQHIPCDVIVFATGFDAISGAIEKIDIRGRGGRTIKQHWSEGVRTYAALMCVGFPNLIFVNGPSGPSAFFSPIILAEYQADWIERCLDHLQREGLDCIEPRPDSEDAWTATVEALAAQTLLPKAKSWYLGDNIPGKPHRMLVYLGGYHAYCEECEKGAANGYQHFTLSTAGKEMSPA